MTTHTPTPWHYSASTGEDGTTYFAIGASSWDKDIAHVCTLSQDVAAFIVRACNAHDDLLNALGTLLMRIDAGGKPYDSDWERARAALAKAKA